MGCQAVWQLPGRHYWNRALQKGIMAGNTYDNRDRIMLRRRDLLAAGGFLTTFGWLRETMASQYPAPKGLPGAPFEDPNLKLASLFRGGTSMYMGSGAWLWRHVPRHQRCEVRRRRYPEPLVDRQSPRRRAHVKLVAGWGIVATLHQDSCFFG